MTARIYYFPIRQPGETQEETNLLMAASCSHPQTEPVNIRNRFPKNKTRAWDQTWGGPCPWENVPEAKTMRPRYLDPRRPWHEGLMDAIGTLVLNVSIITILVAGGRCLVNIFRP